MPNRDGTGPKGMGKGTGLGMGPCSKTDNNQYQENKEGNFGNGQGRSGKPCRGRNCGRGYGRGLSQNKNQEK